MAWELDLSSDLVFTIFQLCKFRKDIEPLQISVFTLRKWV